MDQAASLLRSRPKPVPITEAMRSIMQVLADNLSASRRTTASLESGFHTYIDQCALLLGLDPSSVIFDPPSATFRPKE